MTEEETTLVTELLVALQLVVSSFSLNEKPARITVETPAGWVIGSVTDGTEMAIQNSMGVLMRCAEKLTEIDPEWKRALAQLIPTVRGGTA